MKNITILLIVLMFILLISSSFAISAYIGGLAGSPKAIVNAKQGEIIERVLPVRNVNNLSVTITLIPTGDLENYTKIIENNFTLSPGEEKDVNYVIGVAKTGSTRTNIYVSFKPESGYSVGALATITVRANDTIEGYSEQKLIQELEQSVIETSKNSQSNQENKNNQNPLIYYALISTLVLVIILIILIVFLTKSKKRVLFQKPHNK